MTPIGHRLVSRLLVVTLTFLVAMDASARAEAPVPLARLRFEFGGAQVPIPARWLRPHEVADEVEDLESDDGQALFILANFLSSGDPTRRPRIWAIRKDGRHTRASYTHPDFIRPRYEADGWSSLSTVVGRHRATARLRVAPYVAAKYADRLLLAPRCRNGLCPHRPRESGVEPQGIAARLELTFDGRPLTVAASAYSDLPDPHLSGLAIDEAGRGLFVFLGAGEGERYAAILHVPLTGPIARVIWDDQW